MARLLGFVLGIAVAAAIIFGAYKSSYRSDVPSGDKLTPAGMSAVSDRPPATAAADVAEQPEETLRLEPPELSGEIEEFDVVTDEKETVTAEAPLESPEAVATLEARAAQVAATEATEAPAVSANVESGEVDEPVRLWHGFWHPFRSEWSASGFRQRLEQVTSLDYRVVEVDSGRFEVMFAFEEDADRLRNLAEIEAATGLALSAAAF